MKKQYKVQFTRLSEKQLKKMPFFIHQAVSIWKGSVEKDGMLAARKSSGYHDEPLLGKRTGQRSIRLNRSYRLIYDELENGIIIVVRVLEVHKHDY